MVDMQGAPVVRGVFESLDDWFDDGLLCVDFPGCGEDKIIDEVRASYFPDLSIPKDLKVVCPFREDGCQWEVEYQDYDLHVSTCEFKPTCPLSTLGCSNTAPMSESELECHLSSHHGEHLNIMVNRISILQKQCNTIQEFDEALRNLEVTSTLHCTSWKLTFWGYLEQPYETLLRLLRELQPPEQKILVKLLQRLVLQPLEQEKLLHQLKILRSLDRPKLLRLLDRLEAVELVKLVSLLERLDQYILLRLLDGLEPVEQMKLANLLEQLEPLEQPRLLRLLDRLEPVEQTKLMDQLERLELLGINLNQRVLNELESLHCQAFLRVPRSPLLRLLEKLNKLETFQQTNSLKLECESLNQLELELERLIKEKLKQRKQAQVQEFQLRLELERQATERLLELYKRLLQLLVLWLTTYLSKDGDRRGGFRNLLLDGWWLEFWEIILLAAGDVERNPGPRRMTDEQLAKVDNRVLGKSDLFRVLDAVIECCANWFAVWLSNSHMIASLLLRQSTLVI